MFLFVCSLVGCDFFKPKDQTEEKPVARVNETYLYPSDFAALVPIGQSPEDSALFAEKFVNDWVKKQLMIARSQQEVDINEAEIQRKVLDYTYALTRSAFEKKYIDENLSADVSEAEIKAYYEAHSADFVLKQNIVRCLFAQVPEGAPRQKRFEKDLTEYPETQIGDLIEYCTQFANRTFMEDSVWVDYNELVVGTPYDQVIDPMRILRSRQLLTETDGAFNYYLRILETKMVNDISPLEFVREDIVSIIINKRKIALKRELENKVYEDAKQSGAFEVY